MCLLGICMSDLGQIYLRKGGKKRTILKKNKYWDRDIKAHIDQIRLIKGLHCLPFSLHILDVLLPCKIRLFHFTTVTVIII